MTYHYLEKNELIDVLKKIIKEAEANNIEVNESRESENSHVYKFILKNKPKYELTICKFVLDGYEDKPGINLILSIPNNDEEQSGPYMMTDESEMYALLNKVFNLIKEANKKTNKKLLYEFLK